jgi:hypothetical protein
MESPGPGHGHRGFLVQRNHESGGIVIGVILPLGAALQQRVEATSCNRDIFTILKSGQCSFQIRPLTHAPLPLPENHTQAIFSFFETASLKSTDLKINSARVSGLRDGTVRTGISMIKEDAERRRLELLLPWYAAGTLSRSESDCVEKALAGDVELARRYALVLEELAETINLNKALGEPSASVAETLFAAIDVEEALHRAAPNTALSAGASLAKRA